MASNLKDKKTFLFSAFTLVELLIVIGVLGIISGVTFQTINVKKHQNTAKDAVSRAALEKAVLAMESFYTIKSRYPSSWDELVLSNYLSTVPSGISYIYDAASDSAALYTPMFSRDDFNLKYSTDFKEIRECAVEANPSVGACASDVSGGGSVASSCSADACTTECTSKSCTGGSCTGTGMSTTCTCSGCPVACDASSCVSSCVSSGCTGGVCFGTTGSEKCTCTGCDTTPPTCDATSCRAGCIYDGCTGGFCISGECSCQGCPSCVAASCTSECISKGCTSGLCSGSGSSAVCNCSGCPSASCTLTQCRVDCLVKKCTGGTCLGNICTCSGCSGTLPR